MVRIVHLLSSLLFPLRCRRCGRHGVALCIPCINTIPPAKDTGDRAIIACFDYGNPLVSTAVWELKYHGKSEIMRALVHTATSYIVTMIATGQHVVLVPIPQHKKKTLSRGYNQSALIAKWIAQEIRATIQPVLKKQTFTLPQARIKHRADRLSNVAHSMVATETLDPNHQYLIVDDVTTTGATFIEARRALIEAGAQHVTAIAIAHGYARK